MRTALRPINRAFKAALSSISAPTGGWNARDALGAMELTDAVSIENWYPSTSDLQLRMGYSNFSTGLPSQVESLMAYNGLTANKMLAGSGTALYNVTSGGAVGAAVKSGLTNVRFQYQNYANTSGNYLYMVNGADSPMYWDGTTFTDAAITGVTKANLIHINQHKNRLWFVEKNTLKAWYLSTSAIAGAATAFDLSGVAQMGGYLMAMATWTVDGGQGVDDLAVFITSWGEVIVYKGTDPSSANTWALVGIWQIGAPVGRRCFMKYSGDLLIICQDGVYPMSGALQSSRVNPKVALTNKIQFAVSNAVTNYGDNFGWQLIQFPKQNQLYLNVPVNEGSLQQQYVMNTITKSWCNFTGWAANCWELFNDHIYFGGNTVVGKAWDTFADNGSNITADCLQAFSPMGSPGRIKRFNMIKPYFRTDGSPAISANLNIDFNIEDTTSPISFAPTTYAAWDTALWDTGVWSGGLRPVEKWQGVSGVGVWAAPRVKTASSGIDVHWVSTTIEMENGGVL